MNNNEGAIIGVSTLLTATSWAANNSPWFSIAASCATVIIVIFGIVNYLKKWRQLKN